MRRALTASLGAVVLRSLGAVGLPQDLASAGAVLTSGIEQAVDLGVVSSTRPAARTAGPVG